MVKRKQHGARSAATKKHARGRTKRAPVASSSAARTERELLAVLAVLDVERATVRSKLRAIRVTREQALAAAQLALPGVGAESRELQPIERDVIERVKRIRAMRTRRGAK